MLKLLCKNLALSVIVQLYIGTMSANVNFRWNHVQTFGDKVLNVCTTRTFVYAIYRLIEYPELEGSQEDRSQLLFNSIDTKFETLQLLQC